MYLKLKDESFHTPINTIKELRSVTNCSLKEAKKVLDYNDPQVRLNMLHRKTGELLDQFLYHREKFPELDNEHIYKCVDMMYDVLTEIMNVELDLDKE